PPHPGTAPSKKVRKETDRQEHKRRTQDWMLGTRPLMLSRRLKAAPDRSVVTSSPPWPTFSSGQRMSHSAGGSGLGRGGLVVALTCALKLFDVLVRPCLDDAHRGSQTVAESREPVLHGDRHGWVHGPLDQAIAFETAQGLGEHLLGDP